MVKLTSKRRTCSCKIQERLQGLGADYANERLYLLDNKERQVDTIAYIRGLENHPLRGVEPDIQSALNLIRRTNTRRAPDTLSTSDESSRDADTETDSSGPCHGFSTPTTTESEDDDEPEEEPSQPTLHEVPTVLNEEDQAEHDRILAIIQGRLPSEPRPDTPPRRRSTTRDDLLEEEATPAEIQAGAPAHEEATPPQPSTSSDEETSPMKFAMRSGRIITGAPTKKKKGPPEGS